MESILRLGLATPIKLVSVLNMTSIYHKADIVLCFLP